MHPFRNVNARQLAPLMIVAACVCWQLASIQSSSAQSDLAFEPYPVYIAQEEAFTRCGPSGEFYRTDPLRHGQELQVFAETDDGWLGIRPPNDSFCWIPAETVEMDASDEEGTVIEDRTVAWIGTHLGRARTYRWQVQLAKGEPVTVLGRSEREGPDGPQLWYRIVPPSGEFRWVHRDQVVFSSEELVASIRRSSKGNQVAQTAAKASSDTAQTGRQLSTGSQLSQRGSPASNADPQVAASSGTSILEQNDENWESSAARRSTENPVQPRRDPVQPHRDTVAREAPAATVTDAMKRGGLLASVEFLGRPRMLEIGGAPTAPRADETAADTNWVAGVARPPASSVNHSAVNGNGAYTYSAPVTPFAGNSPLDPRASAPIENRQGTMMLGSGLLGSGVSTATGSTAQGSTAQGSIAQVSGQHPNAWQSPLTVVAPAMQTTRIVSAERIAQIEAETRGADFQRLNLIFSRLMAAQATSAEIEPLATAARSLASSALDSVVAGRARELAERAERYRRVATHRDGQAVIRTASATVPVAQPFSGGATVTSAHYTDTNVDSSTQTGYLVQVYSARSNSPPFALTDNTGRTVAYVTPSPGVNLRTHLNSKVSVSGNSGFLTGLNTPHILATQAVRTPE